MCWEKYTVHIASPTDSSRLAAVVREGSTPKLLCLDLDTPRIYRELALVKSEWSGLPIAINGPFDVDEFRSAVFLDE